MPLEIIELQFQSRNGVEKEMVGLKSALMRPKEFRHENPGFQFQPALFWSPLQIVLENGLAFSWGVIFNKFIIPKGFLLFSLDYVSPTLMDGKHVRQRGNCSSNQLRPKRQASITGEGAGWPRRS